MEALCYRGLSEDDRVDDSVINMSIGWQLEDLWRFKMMFTIVNNLVNSTMNQFWGQAQKRKPITGGYRHRRHVCDSIPLDSNVRRWAPESGMVGTQLPLANKIDEAFVIFSLEPSTTCECKNVKSEAWGKRKLTRIEILVLWREWSTKQVQKVSLCPTITRQQLCTVFEEV